MLFESTINFEPVSLKRHRHRLKGGTYDPSKKEKDDFVKSIENFPTEKMTKPIKYGFGAVLASGKQYVSWIHIDDLVAIFKYVIDHNLEGVYNAVSPYPTTNEELTKAIAKTLNKPLFLPKVPKFILSLLLGEMHEIVTSSQHVSSRKILDVGFQFQNASLAKSLQNLFK
jgi:NAD dependent epimerase/dehydratase family enzyme